MNCEVCGTKMVPAGVSRKTGKSYNAFCPEQKNHGIGTNPVGAPDIRVQRPKSEPDWDAIAFGKTVSLFVAAAIEAGTPPATVTQNIDDYIELAQVVFERTK